MPIQQPFETRPCPQCTVEVSTDASFCMKCGTALTPEIHATDSTVAATAAPTTGSTQRDFGAWWGARSRRQKTGLVAGALIAVLAVGSAVASPENGESDSALATPSQTTLPTDTPDATPTEEPTPSEEPTEDPAAAPATPEPTPEPSPEPTPEPTPTVATFGGGDLIVGADVQPGTYRTRSAQSFCYWERVSGFGGTLDEIIANGTGSGYFTVTITAGDAGFNSSGCGEWSADLSAVTDPAGPITEDGDYIVGTDIAPGTWRSDGGSEFGCYLARLSGFGGTLDEIISNDISTDGGLVVTIASSDKGFETTDCGTWTKVS